MSLKAVAHAEGVSKVVLAGTEPPKTLVSNVGETWVNRYSMNADQFVSMRKAPPSRTSRPTSVLVSLASWNPMLPLVSLLLEVTAGPRGASPNHSADAVGASTRIRSTTATRLLERGMDALYDTSGARE